MAVGCGGGSSGAGGDTAAAPDVPVGDLGPGDTGDLGPGDTGDTTPTDGATDGAPDAVVDVIPADPYEGFEVVPSPTCQVSGAPAPPPPLAMERVLSGLLVSKPVDFQAGPEGSGRVFIVSQIGLVWSAAAITAAGDGQIWLNLVARVDDGPNEGGLLSMAFDPGFVSNGHVFFVSTRTTGGKFQTVVTRITVPDPPFGAPDIDSEIVVIAVDQPYGNHNGGGLAFGPDGHLYFGLGDGGAANDPQGNGQNLSTWLGAMLRLDVSSLDTTGAYTVPPDNPFVDTPGARPEIWAYGLRNPWRYSFDPVGGTFWVGDVGQNKIEEIDILVAGGNYGWKIMEGSQCFSPSFGCNTEGLILPAAEYANPTEGKSVTGGVVYRGSQIPSLYGTYVFADFSLGTVWGLVPDDAEEGWERTTLMETGALVSAFGVDHEGEAYLLDWWSGAVHKIVASDPASAGVPSWPTTLSETGCFQDLEARTFAPGVYPYEVNAPLWSDGAGKERGFSLPAGSTITYQDPGAWELPVGAILLKTFVRPGGDDALETRILVRHDDRWRGATYLWNDEGTDAELLNTAVDEDLGDQIWHYPSRAECRACHTKASGELLGWSTRQLSRGSDMGGFGWKIHQIEALKRAGVLTGAPDDAEALPAFADLDDEATSEEDRVRAYLHANCAHCHQPDTSTTTPLDLRAETALADASACGLPPEKGDVGIANPKVIAPGDPDSSVLLVRMETLDSNDRMPNVGSNVVHEDAVALVRSWILDLGSCPP
jgi:uncharacterized repeat protein (TIGR03806 family)